MTVRCVAENELSRAQEQGIQNLLILLTQFPLDFAFLGCREAVIGFYEKAGFTPY